MPARLLLHRRTALALGVAGLAVLTGCDNHDSAPASTPTPDPDEAVVDGVVTELAGAFQLAVAAGVPELVKLHRAHILALDGTPPAPAPGHAGMDALRRLERTLQADLANASMAAQSGELARLLASMSAAVSQQLVVL